MQNKINILHLENDPNDIELVREILEQANIKCHIDIAENEKGFKELLNKNKYQLILGDYNLPNYDGLLALEYVKNNYGDIPFILVSGSIEEDAGIET